MHFTHKKVRDFEEQDYSKMFKFILALCKLIGITEPPDKDITKLLISHIKMHHSDFSKEEIETAFSLAMAGKLGFEFRHYNRITPQLISHTLNKYKSTRSQEILKFREAVRQESLEKNAKNNQPTERDQMISRIKRAIDHFNKYKNKEKNIRDWGNVHYNFLDSINAVNLSIEDKKKIQEEAKKKLVAEKNREAVKKFQDDFSNALRSQRLSKEIEDIRTGKSIEVRTESKQIALEHIYNDLIAKNTDIADHIKKSLISSNKKGYMQLAKEML